MTTLTFRFFIALAALVLLALPAQAQVVSRDQAGAQVASVLAQALQESRPDLSVARIWVRQDLTLPDGTITWQPGVDPMAWQPGAVTVPVIVRVAGQEAALVEISAELTQRLLLPVVRRPVARGELLDANNIDLVELTLTQPIPDLVVDGEAVIGMAANQSLRPGRPLQHKWFTQPIAVKRGEMVRVIAGHGGVAVETKAVAMQSGQMGAEITLRNPKSMRNFMARVSGAGEVTVVAP